MLLEQKKNVWMGREILDGSSKFQGYVGDVQNMADVNKLYEYVRFQNMGAWHIMCAFRLPGPNFVENEDYFDDDEHEGGKVLLDYMIDAKLTNRAIFITRFYDGAHIRQQRFEHIVAAAKSAVNQKLYNRITGEFQFSWGKRRGSQTGAHGGDNSSG